MAIVAWMIPERFWGNIGRVAGYLTIRVLAKRTQSSIRRRQLELRGWQNTVPLRDLEIEAIAHGYRSQFQFLREYRTSGWNPVIEVCGIGHIHAAMDNGCGVILWVSRFVYSDLVTKKGLHQLGFRVSHLSRPSHGYSTTRFGMALLNPVRRRIEDRYLWERVLIRSPGDSGAAMRVLRQRLSENRVVSIAVGDQGRRTLEVPFLEDHLCLATGPINLAIKAKAPLLPIFTLRNSSGTFEVHVTSPLPIELNQEGGYELVAREYSRRLEYFVLKYPSQWRR